MKKEEIELLRQAREKLYSLNLFKEGYVVDLAIQSLTSPTQEGVVSTEYVSKIANDIYNQMVVEMPYNEPMHLTPYIQEAICIAYTKAMHTYASQTREEDKTSEFSLIDDLLKYAPYSERTTLRERASKLANEYNLLKVEHEELKSTRQEELKQHADNLNNAIQYYFDVLEEVRGENFKDKPDHVLKKMIEANNLYQEYLNRK